MRGSKRVRDTREIPETPVRKPPRGRAGVASQRRGGGRNVVRREAVVAQDEELFTSPAFKRAGSSNPVKPRGSVPSPVSARRQEETDSPSNTTRSGQGDIVANTTLLAQRSIHLSHEAVQSILRSVLSDIKGRIDNLDRAVKRKMDNYEEAVNTSVRFMANQMRSKDSKARINVELASRSSVYSGSFYSRLYGMQFISKFNKVLRDSAEFETEVELCQVLEEVEAVLHAMVFRRLPNERTAERLARSEVHARACRFRRDICLSMIRTAENNETVGTEMLSFGSEVKRIPRPKWLRKGFIKKSMMYDVLSAEENFLSKFDKSTPKKKNTLEGCGGMQWEENVERGLLGEEIVKRLNQKHIQHSNKSREHVRSDLFIQLGFLWHSEVVSEFKKEPVQIVQLDLSQIPVTKPWKAGEEDTMHRKNLEKWQKLLDIYREEMSVIVEYDVEVSEKKPFTGVGESRTLQRSINLLLVSLSFCTRFTMCLKADDFFAMHSAAMLCVFMIACTFRGMVREYVSHGVQLPDEDKNAESISKRSISTLVLDLVPTYAATRHALFDNNILSTITEEYENLHTGNAPVGLFGEQEGDLFMSEDGDSEDGYSEEDEEIMAMQNVNFKS